MTDTIKFPLTGTQAFIDECARAQPKYKRVDLGLKRESIPIDYKDGSHREWEIHNAAFNDGWNEAIDDIKSKYGDLYVEVK